MERSSILILLTSCQQTCMAYTIAVFAVKTSDGGQRNCPKHVEFHSKNKFEELVYLVGFIVKKVLFIIHFCCCIVISQPYREIYVINYKQ